MYWAADDRRSFEVASPPVERSTMTSLYASPTITILPDPPPPPTAIGLIAGGGRLPILVADGLRAQGHPVHGLGLSNQYELELPSRCSTFEEVGLLRIGSWGRILARKGVHHAIMVGKVDKAKLMHDPWRMFKNLPDVRCVVNWYKHLRHDRRSHAVLTAIANELDRWGVALLDSTAPITNELAAPGIMTNRRPTAEQQADIDFVWPMLGEALRLDIGQAIAVRERDVISVEAVEGTDQMIDRTGKLCRAKGWTLCKGARTGHDRRSDVPTVGINTLRKLHENGGGCLALAAGDVIMLDKAEMIDVADRLGISIVGVPPAHA